MIVAMGKDGAIGKEGNLLWTLPGDLKRFKNITMGHPVVMGRKTWDSLPKRPLPGRRNIILTRNKDFNEDGAEIAHSVTAALAMTEGENPFIIGGAEIYRQFLPFATKLFLTEVDDYQPDADARLQINLEDWEEIERSENYFTPDGVRYCYITYTRK